MKKIIYAFALTAALIVTSAANALVSSNLNQTTQTKTQTFKKTCEVCPYADETMCRTWTPTCADDDLTLIDPGKLKPCPLYCTTCNKLTGKCTVCAKGYTINTSGGCTLHIVTSVGSNKPEEFEISSKPEEFERGTTTTTTATVSSCPSGMTKSSDGCCCVNN